MKEQTLERIGRTIDRGDFANGEAVAEFEQRFADYCGLRHCVGVSSGLDALRVSLLASGIAAGDGVIVPASTFAATFEAVIQAGGSPIVVDIADGDYNIDVDQMADMQQLSRIADAHGLAIVEDACQAHGASRDGVRVGSAARATAFSFYPAKNLGAMGDAGALVTDDAELAAHARALREHGETGKYHHEYVGYTARLDTIQAIVLLEKLPLLDEWNGQRREAASFYEQSLSEIEGLRLPPVPDGSEPVWHLYVVRAPQPDLLAAFLAERGIQTARHYPQPPHLAPAYRTLGFAPGDFPIAEALAREALSLPLYPGISDAQLESVCEAVHDYFRVEAQRPAALRLG